MTLSNFAKILHTHIGNGQKTSDFILCLTDNIMEEPLAKSGERKMGYNELNPLIKKSPDTLRKIYNGLRSLSKRDAGAIISFLDKNKFSEYLLTFSPDAICLIGDVLQEEGVTFDDVDSDIIVDTCANLFASILRSRASGADSDSLPVTANSAKETSDEMNEMFLRMTANYCVMEIINRRPPILYRADSVNLNVFVRKIENMLDNTYEQKHNDAAVYVAIKIFYQKLYIQALSIEANLNMQFDFDEETSYEDKSAFINMEEDESSIELEGTSRFSEIPKLTPEIIRKANDPLGMVAVAIKEWGNFRDEMNFLYKEICGGNI